MKAPHERDRYNAIVFWHSLEHFSNPVAAVARAYEALKPGEELSSMEAAFDRAEEDYRPGDAKKTK